MGIGPALAVVVVGLLLGLLRNIWVIPIDFIYGKPIRIDIPIPYLPIDLVLVSNPDHIKVLREDPDCARLHEIPTTQLPKWAQLYFSGTRFRDVAGDKWFVPFETANQTTHYADRRGTIAGKLDEEDRFSTEDVQKIAKLLESSASDEALAAAMAPIVNSRFLEGHADVSLEVVRNARAVFNNPGQALIPGKFNTATKGAQAVVDYCAAKGPIQGLLAVDVAHNIGAVSNVVPGALRALRDDVDSDLVTIFTKPNNCPTPNVPRVAVAASKFSGLLTYPAAPNKTIFLISIAKAAGKTHSLFFTFGTGVPERSCAFRPFFEAFMTDLQKELKAFGKGTES